MSDEKIGLAEAIAKVKQDLLDTRYRLADPTPLFFIEQVEVELTVKMIKESKGSVNIQVVEIGGGVAKEDTQTIKVTLSGLMSKDEILAQMPEEARKQVEQKAVNFTRGNGGSLTPDDI